MARVVVCSDYATVAAHAWLPGPTAQYLLKGAVDTGCQDWSRHLAFSKPGWENTSTGDQVLNPREIKRNVLNVQLWTHPCAPLTPGAMKTLWAL